MNPICKDRKCSSGNSDNYKNREGTPREQNTSVLQEGLLGVQEKLSRRTTKMVSGPGVGIQERVLENHR